MATFIRGDDDFDTADVNGPLFTAELSSNFGISNIAWTKVPLNTEVYDSDGCYDPSTYRFTPTKAGYYNVYGSVRITATAVRAVYVNIYKNGGSFAWRLSDYNTNASSIINFSQNVSSLVPFNGSSDYIELYVWAQSNSGALSVTNGRDTKLSAHWVKEL